MRLNELFDVTYGNKFDLNKMRQLPRRLGGVNFVGRSEKNLGVTATVAIVSNPPYPAGLITVALGGTKLLCSYIQESPFYTAQNVAVLRPLRPMSFAEKLYICLCIRANRFRYGAFGREANRTLRTLRIPSSSQFPNWVDSTNSQADRVLVDILEDIERFSIGRNRRRSDDTKDLAPVSSLFEVVYGTNLELNKLKLKRDGINFVSRTARNNGISAKVDEIPGLPPTPGGVLTVAGGGSVLETFYQEAPFYSGRDLYFLRPHIKMSPEELLYYARAIRANQYRFNYGRQANRTLKDLLIPARTTIPEWVYGKCKKVAHEIGEQMGRER